MKLDPRSAVESLSARQRDQLAEFEAMLRDQAIPLGLVSQGDRGRLWERHILDSLRALACLPRVPVTMLDVGSGAGLPGIPLAIARDDCTLVLIEARSRRAAFLELAKETLGLSNTQVVHGRAEEYAWRGRVAVARAVADPQKAWQMCRPLLERGGFLVYFAGRSWPDAPGPGARPVAAKWKICGKPLFPWQGPIIKMWASEERLPTA